MCILVHKPKGIEMPKREFLKNCHDNNPDGIGIAWIDDRGITHIRKGFMKFKAFMKFLKSVNGLKDMDVILHFRWATHGSVSPGNCHPFPIDVNLRNLRSTSYSGRFSILAHNGVIFEYGNVSKGSKNDLSDTMILSKRIHEHGIKSREIQGVIAKGGKFCISDRDGNIQRYGDFIEEDGIYWSNDGYAYSQLDVYRPVYKPIKSQIKYNNWSKYQISKTDEIYVDDVDPFDDWYRDMILCNDLDDMGMCIHQPKCKKDHECYICGLTIPALSKRQEYVDICPFYQWTKDIIDPFVCR